VISWAPLFREARVLTGNGVGSAEGGERRLRANSVECVILFAMVIFYRRDWRRLAAGGGQLCRLVLRRGLGSQDCSFGEAGECAGKSVGEHGTGHLANPRRQGGLGVKGHITWMGRWSRRQPRANHGAAPLTFRHPDGRAAHRLAVQTAATITQLAV
jgi:hypothetical protein